MYINLVIFIYETNYNLVFEGQHIFIETKINSNASLQYSRLKICCI